MGSVESIINSLSGFISILGPVVLIVFILLTCWKRVPADKALVITGIKKRVLSGKGGFMIPFLETSCLISLENIAMTTDVNDAPSKQGIFVNVVGTAVVKVENTDESILRSVEQFSNGGVENTVNVISDMVEKILEGKLRGIVSTLTVEQINEDRASFEQKIEDNIRKELNSMGLSLISYNILKITTQGGYLENRAKPQIAQAKADADIATAERKRDTDVKTAAADREGQKAQLLAQTEIEEAERNKSLKVESYRAERDKAKADADVSYGLQKLENDSVLAEKNAKLQEKNAIVKEKELVSTVIKPAEAKKAQTEIDAEADKIRKIKEAEANAERIKIEAKAKADARKIEAEANAEAVKVMGEAEADAIKAKGVAEAEAKDRLAEAMNKYGEAAVVELIVSRLPDIMREVAKPMEQVDKITIIDNGGGQGGSKVSKIVTDVAANGFEVLKDLTGVDMTNLISTVVQGKGLNKDNVEAELKKVNITDAVKALGEVTSTKED